MQIDYNALNEFLTKLLILVTAIPLHELAHGFVAYKLGDPTAKNMGRLTLNPLKHMDPVGTLLMLFVGFGWAKPVPVNTRYFKNTKQGMILVSIAGPVTNLLLALIFLLLTKLYMTNTAIMSVLSYNSFIFWLDILFGMCTINVTLAIFNMFPIPPLDGSKIILAVLPDKIYHAMLQYQRQITLVTCLLLFSGLLSTPISSLSYVTVKALDQMTAFLGKIF